MNRSGRLLLFLAGVTLVAAVASAGQAKPAVTPPATTTQKPADEGAPKKLAAPVRGEALLGYTKPVSKREGNLIVTTIKVKNLSAGAIAGLKVDEFWYDKAGEPVTGSQPFRWRKPMQPGEVIEVVLKVPTNPKMDRNQYKFEHANGTIKTQLLPKL
ncbi:MAG TPA: hypothetical protein VFU28_06815 [Vicinamibacterales bacterium]|nr:hypothetical protein [Vicinamibacterales bacterium]